MDDQGEAGSRRAKGCSSQVCHLQPLGVHGVQAAESTMSDVVWRAVQAADAQKEAAVRSAIADGWQREMQRLEAQLQDLQHELRREREQVG